MIRTAGQDVVHLACFGNGASAAGPHPDCPITSSHDHYTFKSVTQCGLLLTPSLFTQISSPVEWADVLNNKVTK